MATFLKYLLAVFSLLIGTTYATCGLDWIFDSYEKCPRAVLLEADGSIAHKMPLSAFTFSFFVKLEDRLNEDVTLFSYASLKNNEANEVYFEINNDESYAALSINGYAAIFETVPKRNEWAHIAVTWNTVNGDVFYYLNGESQRVSKSRVVRAGYTLANQGCIVIGQDQDKYNGGFDSSQGLTGRLTQVNIWDRVLSPDEVKKVQSCQLAGNVVSWDSALWGFADNIMERPTTAPCHVECGQIRP